MVTFFNDEMDRLKKVWDDVQTEMESITQRQNELNTLMIRLQAQYAEVKELKEKWLLEDKVSTVCCDSSAPVTD